MTQPQQAKSPTKRRPKITKEDPPPVREQRYDWEAIAEELRAAPKTWHKIFERDSTGFFTSIQRGEIAALRPSLGFEARSANNTRGRPRSDPAGFEPRTCTLYLRWVKPKRSPGKSKES